MTSVLFARTDRTSGPVRVWTPVTIDDGQRNTTVRFPFGVLQGRACVQPPPWGATFFPPCLRGLCFIFDN